MGPARQLTRPAGGSFGSPVELVTEQQGAYAPEDGIDDRGSAWIAWEGPFDGASAGLPFAHVEVTSVGVGATVPGPVEVLRTPGLGQLGGFGPLLEVDPRGDAIAVWQNLTRNGGTVKIAVARRAAGGPWGTARPVGNSYNGGNFAAAIGPTGQAIVAWDSLVSPVQAVIAESPAGALGRATRVAPTRENSAAPEVTIDARGRGTAVWWDLGSSLQYATTN